MHRNTASKVQPSGAASEVDSKNRRIKNEHGGGRGHAQERSRRRVGVHGGHMRDAQRAMSPDSPEQLPRLGRQEPSRPVPRLSSGLPASGCHPTLGAIVLTAMTPGPTHASCFLWPGQRGASLIPSHPPCSLVLGLSRVLGDRHQPGKGLSVQQEVGWEEVSWVCDLPRARGGVAPTLRSKPACPRVDAHLPVREKEGSGAWCSTRHTQQVLTEGGRVTHVGVWPSSSPEPPPRGAIGSQGLL